MLSTEEYQRNRPDVIVGLITSRNPKPPAATDCPILDWQAAGLRAPSWFRLFLVTLPQVSVRIAGRLSADDWSAVQTCFQSGFGKS